MPTYAYYCKACGKHYDDFRSIRDRRTPLECPECGAKAELMPFYPGVAQKGVVLNDITDDMGDGKGKRTMSRHENLQSCRKLVRDPVGLLWQTRQCRSDEQSQVGNPGEFEIE